MCNTALTVVFSCSTVIMGSLRKQGYQLEAEEKMMLAWKIKQEEFVSFHTYTLFQAPLSKSFSLTLNQSSCLCSWSPITVALYQNRAAGFYPLYLGHWPVFFRQMRNYRGKEERGGDRKEEGKKADTSTYDHSLNSPQNVNNDSCAYVKDTKPKLVCP